MAIGACALPILIGVVPYLISHRFDAYLDANIWTIARRFAGPKPLHPALLDVVREQIEAFFPTWLLIPFIPAALAKAHYTADRRLFRVLSLWLFCNVATVFSMREFLGYQFIPAMAPMALLAAWVLVRVIDIRFVTRAAIALAVVSILAHGIGRYVRLAGPDDIAQAGEYLRGKPQHQGKWLYVATGDPAIYLLSNAPVPTRFPYPAHLIAPDQEEAAGVNGQREIERIFSQHPAYVVYRGSLCSLNDFGTGPQQLICAALRGNYQLVYSAGSLGVYVRRS
jgi:hypothetical protein